MAKRRVVLTGAAGYVAQRMFAELSERWDLVPIDVQAASRTGGAPVPGLVVADLTDRNRDAYRHLFRGADAVIHCGYVRAPGLDATTWQNNSDAKYWAEHDNVALAYNVYRVALEEGVRRVVMASSNHAADYYERLVWADRLELVTPEMPHRSDNWYGWAKAAYELQGFVFASGKVDGRTLEVVQWRIGGPRDDDVERVEAGDVKAMHRALGAYLSRRDQVQQAIRMVEAEDIRDEHGIPFLIVYGISGNTHRFWSLTSARQKIGYVPEDDSQVRFADEIARITRAAKPGPQRPPKDHA
ncbi:MAG: NAD(P)-dependent oxidoreductase [Candidatus Rokubacteria bacterium]|nr:NAD(P)-dependent oxidoreductase [Candidatus Rokubacteria bacterium]